MVGLKIFSNGGLSEQNRRSTRFQRGRSLLVANEVIALSLRNENGQFRRIALFQAADRCDRAQQIGYGLPIDFGDDKISFQRDGARGPGFVHAGHDQTDGRMQTKTRSEVVR